jgi:hypothetical protein
MLDAMQESATKYETKRRNVRQGAPQNVPDQAGQSGMTGHTMVHPPVYYTGAQQNGYFLQQQALQLQQHQALQQGMHQQYTYGNGDQGSSYDTAESEPTQSPANWAEEMEQQDELTNFSNNLVKKVNDGQMMHAPNNGQNPITGQVATTVPIPLIGQAGPSNQAVGNGGHPGYSTMVAPPGMIVYKKRKDDFKPVSYGKKNKNAHDDNKENRPPAKMMQLATLADNPGNGETSSSD